MLLPSPARRSLVLITLLSEFDMAQSWFYYLLLCDVCGGIDTVTHVQSDWMRSF